MSKEMCGCIRCTDKRRNELPDDAPWQDKLLGPGFRYCCEICGNKRCPHHTDHNFACTGSNEPGQLGSAYERVDE